MSVQSVYLINGGGGGRGGIRGFWLYQNTIYLIPHQTLRGRFIDNQLSLVPSLYSVGGVWSPLYSLPPEKYVILPKSFSPPSPLRLL